MQIHLEGKESSQNESLTLPTSRRSCIVTESTKSFSRRNTWRNVVVRWTTPIVFPVLLLHPAGRTKMPRYHVHKPETRVSRSKSTGLEIRPISRIQELARSFPLFSLWMLWRIVSILAPRPLSTRSNVHGSLLMFTCMSTSARNLYPRSWQYKEGCDPQQRLV